MVPINDSMMSPFVSLTVTIWDCPGRNAKFVRFFLGFGFLLGLSSWSEVMG